MHGPCHTAWDAGGKPVLDMRVRCPDKGSILFCSLGHLSKLSFLPGNVLRYPLGTSGFSVFFAREAATLPQSKKSSSENFPVGLDHEGLLATG